MGRIYLYWFIIVQYFCCSIEGIHKTLRDSELGRKPQDELLDGKYVCQDANHTTIIFSNTEIKTIKAPFIVSDMPICLKLDDAKIEKLSRGVFKELRNLEYLSLKNNLISPLEALREGHECLKILNLDSMKISPTIKDTGYFPKLRKLYLRNNGIKDIYANNSFPQLTDLYISDNEINEDRFSWLPNTIRSLYIKNHKLQKLTLNNFPHLELLDFSQDEKHLSLLTTIELKNLHKLMYIYGNNNNLQRILASTFEEMKSLRTLILSHNNITEIHAQAFYYMPHLQNLFLSANQITGIPTLHRASRLQSLYLNDNKIKRIHIQAFRGLSQLRELYLQNNEIEQIADGAFTGLQTLNKLDMSSNQLTYIYPMWMTMMTNLQSLNVANNKFKDLDSFHISKASKLQDLYIQRNQFKIIKVNVLNNKLPDNCTIYFDGPL